MTYFKWLINYPCNGYLRMRTKILLKSEPEHMWSNKDTLIIMCSRAQYRNKLQI